MQMRFDVDDEAAAHSTREQLVGRFDRWLEHHPEHAPAERWDVDLILQWKFAYGDGDYGHWTRADVDDLLLEHLPRKFSASPQDAASIPPSVAALAGFLQDEGLLDEHSDTADAIATRAQALTRSFLDAMADPGNFGMAKSLFSSVGLDEDAVLDQAGIETAVARFNDLPFEERGRVLGLGDLDRDDDEEEEGPDLPALPLREVPSPADLPALTGRALLLVRVQAFHDALGPDGIRLTKAGRPRLPDARRLAPATLSDRAVEVAGVRSVDDLPGLLSLGLVAMEAGAVEPDETETPPRLVPVPGWSEVPVAVRWQAVAHAAMGLGPATLSVGHAMPTPLVELADEVVLHVLGMLWGVGEPVPVRTFAGMLLEAAGLEEPTARVLARLEPEKRTKLCETILLGGVASLLEAGVVHVDEPDGETPLVSLTDAGARLAAPVLAEIGFDVILPEDVARLTAGELLDALVERGDDDVELAARLWTRDRAVPPLAAELVAELAAAPEPVRVMLGFGLLDALGADAVEAVRGARDGPIGPHAWLFLASHGDVPAEEIPPQMAVEAAITLFVATADMGSPADVVELVLGNIPAPEHPAFIDHLAAADHPRTGELLDTLGRHHPDKQVAKHARKAAHRWRSGGARAR